jgi:hypothetical protein
MKGIRHERLQATGIRQQVSGYRTSLGIRTLAVRYPSFPQPLTYVIPAQAGIHDAANTPA